MQALMRERRELVFPVVTRMLLGMPAGEVTRCFQPVCAAANDDDDVDLHGAIARPTPVQWQQLIFIEVIRDGLHLHILALQNSPPLA